MSARQRVLEVLSSHRTNLRNNGSIFLIIDQMMLSVISVIFTTGLFLALCLPVEGVLERLLISGKLS